MSFRVLRNCLLWIGLSAALAPQPLRACAACFGKSDSPLAKGMNMGILSLLLVVVFVLGGIASFFIYLARKSAAAAAASSSKPVNQPANSLPSK